MSDPLTRAARCLKHAEECRRLAEIAVQDTLKAQYRSMAEHYAALAEDERKIAESLQRSGAAGRTADLLPMH
jgi:hypothetical protein